jgi:soluble lytic murein transglycosylase-like protein
MYIIILIISLLLSSGLAYGDIYQFNSPDGSISFTNVPTEKGGRIVYKEPKIKSNLKAVRTNINKEAFDAIATEKASKYSLDPDLVKAVIKAESNWNPHAVSPKGARGLMQLMPATANELGVYNSFDPEDNIDGGSRYLRHLLEKFNGDLRLALAAYNAGPARVEKNNSIPAIPETVQYVRRVMSLYTGLPTLSYSNTLAGGKKEITQIKKYQLEDGTIFFTNTKLIY